ncbi:ABC transporter permease [Alkalihalobacillus trypoxylicola]|uniref:ABC transporter permease n=1 Tax=Alkalihalobacillus trypoxylicola TaxID=519424 RepID=A0A162CTX2_9BACI|nr:ABC transporter permease [Alkalihalobacillus trypoxylicola]KYG26634.1 ABC transporter permease [Alkalihalobacillus trypoxylicola]GAF64220.1 ABC transporter permease protein [Bacillus sp. TS-2]
MNLKKHHADYIKHVKKEKYLVLTVQLSFLLLFILFWELAARLQWIDPLLFSMPSRIGNLLVSQMTDGSLFIHTSFTLFETILGFILGTLFGALLASLLWWSPFISKVSDPYLVVLNSMPKVALGPLLIVGLGPNFTSIIAMGALISIIITTIVIYSAFKEVDQNYVKVLQTFGASKTQIFTNAILPSCMPTIISTLKVNVGLSWVGVIVGEFLVSKQGLGYLIIYGFQVFNFTLVLMSLVVIAILATVMYKLVEMLEKKLIHF